MLLLKWQFWHSTSRQTHNTASSYHDYQVGDIMIFPRKWSLYPLNHQISPVNPSNVQVQGSHISRSHLWPRVIRRKARSHHRFVGFQPRLGCTPMGKPWSDLMGTDRKFRNGGCLGNSKSLCFKVLRWKKTLDFTQWRSSAFYTQFRFPHLHELSIQWSWKKTYKSDDHPRFP